MTEYDLEWWRMAFDLVAHVVISLVGLAALTLAWRAPDEGSLPLVFSKEDKARDDGIRNMRHVLLAGLGVVLIGVGVWGLS